MTASHSAFAVSADSSTSSVSPGPVSATQPLPDFTTVNPAGSACSVTQFSPPPQWVSW
ncbi:hypothetical protein [Streptomyces sp. NPDC002215]|uniref:hypothetical protein n=1 Tax=Streptomyces sp. NPDC002215 TaxID=3154412 RepID=UPI00332797D4